MSGGYRTHDRCPMAPRWCGRRSRRPQGVGSSGVKCIPRSHDSGRYPHQPNSVGDTLVAFDRLVVAGDARAPAAWSSPISIVGPAQICSSSAACCGSISTSQPRTFRTLNISAKHLTRCSTVQFRFARDSKPQWIKAKRSPKHRFRHFAERPRRWRKTSLTRSLLRLKGGSRDD